jgi:hypothetical protein
MPCFDRLRYRRQDGHVLLYAFDLIELDGDDLRHEPVERRKTALAKLMRHANAPQRAARHEDDYDVLADGVVVGRIFKGHAAPVGAPWMWTLAFGHHEDRTPTHGYAATPEDDNGGFREELAAHVNITCCGQNPAAPAVERARHLHGCENENPFVQI